MRCGAQPIPTPGQTDRLAGLESALRDRSIRGPELSSILRICRPGEISHWQPRYQKTTACRFESTTTAKQLRWRRLWGGRVVAFATTSSPPSAPASEPELYSIAIFIMAAPAPPVRVDI